LLTIRRDTLENKVLDGLRHQLMQPEMVRTFVDEFRRELNRQARELDARRGYVTGDLAKIERNIGRLIEAIKAGVPGATIKDEMAALETRRGDLLAQLKAVPPPAPRLHPNIGAVYKEKIASLREALNAERTRLEAAEHIRGLIEEIRLVPEKDRLRIELFGQLSALFNLANQLPRSGRTKRASNAGCEGAIWGSTYQSSAAVGMAPHRL
jgi:site-specific DNA recombinase